jgi:hypothetical protein
MQITKSNRERISIVEISVSIFGTEIEYGFDEL